MSNILFNFFNNIFKKQEPQRAFALGAFPNEPDNRDIPFSATLTTLTPPQFPSQITAPNFLETERLLQGVLGTCVEHSFEFEKRCIDKTLHSRRVPYCITRNELGMATNAPQGLPQREAAKVACVVGTPKDSGLDNNLLSPVDYSSLTITQFMRNDANKYRFGGFAFVEISEQGIKQALANGHIIHITIAIDWNKIDPDGTVHPAEKVSGYHEIALGASDDLSGKFRCANWWGFDLYVQYNELEDVIVDALVFTDIPEDLLLRAKQTPFIFTTTLKYGMNSNAVMQLQKKLSLMGLYNANFDRVFGKLTLQAVMNYQRIKGLTVDGVVGPKTLLELNN
jgi:hypothetical protein